MTASERVEIGKSIGDLRNCVQTLELQVARMEKAVEALAGLQHSHSELQGRVSELLGFRAAMLWCAGLVGAGAVGRLLALMVGR